MPTQKSFGSSLEIPLGIADGSGNVSLVVSLQTNGTPIRSTLEVSESPTRNGSKVGLTLTVSIPISLEFVSSGNSPEKA